VKNQHEEIQTMTMRQSGNANSLYAASHTVVSLFNISPSIFN